MRHNKKFNHLGLSLIHISFHGLYRSLVHNMVVGVSEGYKKELELSLIHI